jgi:VIT1/CCC1 family predicted Fe2+/Mn2+ transporter
MRSGPGRGYTGDDLILLRCGAESEVGEGATFFSSWKPHENNRGKEVRKPAAPFCGVTFSLLGGGAVMLYVALFFFVGAIVLMVLDLVGLTPAAAVIATMALLLSFAFVVAKELAAEYHRRHLPH